MKTQENGKYSKSINQKFSNKIKNGIYKNNNANKTQLSQTNIICQSVSPIIIDV